MEDILRAVTRLRDPSVIATMPFRVDATGRLDFTNVHPDVLAFKRAFEAYCWTEGYPFFACDIAHEGVRVIHWTLGDDLDLAQWEFVRRLGEEACRRVKVHLVQLADPTWWVLRDDFPSCARA